MIVGISLQTALICALRIHARDAMKARYRAAGRKLSTIPPAELTRDADALIPDLVPDAITTQGALISRRNSCASVRCKIGDVHVDQSRCQGDLATWKVEAWQGRSASVQRSWKLYCNRT
jgi:hypothetical protein